MSSPACTPSPGPPARHTPFVVHVPIAAAAGALAGGLWLRSTDPVVSGGLAPCPIRSLTGLWCPGCGLTRATHQLLHGDVVQALSFNVLTPLVLAGLAIVWFTWFRVASGAGVPRRVRSIGPAAYATGAALLAVFVVVRNVPGAEVLRGG